VTHDSTMVALRIPPAVGQQALALAKDLPGLLPLDELHVTLALLDGQPNAEQLAQTVNAFMTERFAPDLTLNGVGRFMDKPDQDCIYLNVDSPQLPGFRQALVDQLTKNGFSVVSDHGFTPHASLAYVPKDYPTPTLALDPLACTPDTLWLANGEQGQDYAFAGKAMSSETGPTGGFITMSPIGDKEDELMTDETKEAILAVEKADGPYAYEEEQKLPIPDAQHVLLAAEALGPNPPHGHGADIPADKLGQVKAKIRARGKELGMSQDDLAKVNAYLSGHMPADVAGKDAEQTWTAAFDHVFALTGDEEKAALAAQGAINRATMLGRKSVDGSLPTEVAGWGILFSGPEDLDLQDTYFDDATDLALKYYPNAPLWYEHGHDPVYGARIIGHRTKAQVYPCGVWMEHALHTDDPLYQRTAQEAADGQLAYSSDSISHYAQRGFDPSDGRLGLWPLAGCSLTKQPAEPGLGPVSAKSFGEALKSAVLEAREAQKSDKEGPADDTDANVGSASEDKSMPDQIPHVEPTGVTIEAPIEQVDAAVDAGLNSLAQMYGVNPPDAGAVRSAMDAHIAEMKAAGMADPGLCKALGLDEKATPDAVAEHLNNMYSKATQAPEPEPQPQPTPEQVPAQQAAPEETPVVPPVAPKYNFGALSNHLNSGVAGKSQEIPFMTGELSAAAKAATVNVTHDLKPPSILEMTADMLRMRSGLGPKYAFRSEKAMTSAAGPTGGYIMHQEIVPTVLDPLRPQIVCNQLGATRIDMQGTMVREQPVMNTAPEAYWFGENQTLNDDQPAYRTVTMIPRGIAGLVKIPWNVEQNMSPQADKQLREQLSKSIALKIDKSALLSNGGSQVSGQGTEPLGLLNIPGVQTKTFGTNGRVPTFQDIGDAFGLLDDANVPYDASSKRGLAVHSKIARAFWNATDALGNPLLRESWAAAEEKKLLAMPYGISNQIPITLTVGSRTDGSYVFLGDWQYMYIGLSDQVELRLDQTFAANGQTGLLMYVYADIKIVYPQAFVVMKNVVPPTISGTTNSTNS
jgi:HK97 family phage major capsid protein